MGHIFYLMGKSASGKDTVYGELQKRSDLEKMILYTTRPIRAGEQEGREYCFTGRQQLDELRAAGKVIEERTYQTVHGPWTYFTVDDGRIDPEKKDYLGIGTLESYIKLKDYFGAQVLVPLYIEVEDGERLMRALRREQKQSQPKYAELCRRFLADSEDFSEENLKKAGISKRFSNENLPDCLAEIEKTLEAML